MKYVRAVLSFLAGLLPFVRSKAADVAPEIQAEVDRILKRAKADVEGVKANNTVADLKKRMDDDILAVKQTAEHHIDLIRKTALASIERASAKLPDLSALSGSFTGPTGPSAPVA